MTQEEKQLLLKDLCARFPYGVICRLSAKDTDVSITEKLEIGGLEHFISGTMDVKPYLRPMSSMTEEEKEKFSEEIHKDFLLAKEAVIENDLKKSTSGFNKQDWLNAHHFDYRGLIGKGLALEVTPSNNPYK